MVSLPFRDRDEAARALSRELVRYRDTHPVVLAIPRGAVPMGRVVADALDAELDVVLVRKLGAPFDPELAIGTIDELGRIQVSEHAQWTGATRQYIEREAERQLALIRARRARYRPGRAPIALAGRTVIVLDDGLATGSTMTAALKAVRAQGPARLVCAVPVAAEDSLAEVARLADDVVCLATPRPFNAVGRYYRHFTGITDEEVIDVLARGDTPLPAVAHPDRATTTASTTAAAPAPAPAPATTPATTPALSTSPVRIDASGVVLEGEMTSPPSPLGLVIFVHGSGSSRHSPRNRHVAHALNARGFATLLFDLLSEAEDRVTATRFDIALLARRLDAAIDWARRETRQRPLPIGLFGASTGAAAALVAASQRSDDIALVVSRGGRPDLAGPAALARVRAPTLLIVGANDQTVLALNRSAQALLQGPSELVLVPGASHLFEEPGALERVEALAGDWCLRWFAQAAHAPSVAKSTTG